MGDLKIQMDWHGLGGVEGLGRVKFLNLCISPKNAGGIGGSR